MPIQEDAEGRLSVLYVEDEPLNVLMMQALFGYRPMLKLLVANDGDAALRLAAEQPLALLLLDLHLPDCHGAVLLERLRQLPTCSAAPAIAVTSDRGFDRTGSGFCEIWHKPFLLFHTLERIDKRLLPQRGQVPPTTARVMLTAA